MALADGLIAYWSPWLGSSGYRLLDRTGRGNHGTLTNMDAGTDWVGATIQGRSGYALDFDGSNDYANIPFRDNTNTFTISAWCYMYQAGTLQALWWRDNHSYFYNLGANSFVLNFGPTGSTEFTVTGNIIGRWANVVLTYDGSTGRGYIDGLQSGSRNAVTTVNNTNAITLSSRQAGTFWYAKSQIAEFNFYNRALNPPEVHALYRLGPGWYRPYAKRGYGYAVAGFKAYWHRRQQQVIGGGLK